jgi:selenocysteine lyase/cysteine desulfurase
VVLQPLEYVISLLNYLDASQSSGVVPIYIASLGVDALISTGYKWLCGLFGAAFLYLDPE